MIIAMDKDYHTLTPELYENLNNKVNMHVDDLHKIFTEVLEKFADKGRMDLIIYITLRSNSVTEHFHEYEMNDLYWKINNTHVRKRLIGKFKTDGIKVRIRYAWENTGDRPGPIWCSGMLISCKWDRDYSKKSSCLIS